MATISGEVSRVIFFNEDNGYQIISLLTNGNLVDKPENINSLLKMDNTAFVTLYGNKLYEGASMEFKGEWITHPKFGVQFKSSEFYEIPPSTKQGLISFLSSPFFDGIGKVRAKKIVDHFGDDTYKILETDIDRLSEIKGISAKNIKNIKNAWEKNKEIKDIMIFLQGFNISPVMAYKIYDTFKEDCVSKIKENPYVLIDEVKGMGFMGADKIALQLGFDVFHPYRVQSCIVFILNQSANDGHCFLYKNQVHDEIKKFLGSDFPSDKLEENIKSLIEDEKIMEYEEKFYTKKSWRCENYVADKISMLLKNKKNNQLDIEEFFKQKAINKEYILSEEQEQAVLGILNEGISILTGGPGVGKSFTTRTIVDALDFCGYNFCLAAPTGKAARRMRELIERPASTIHRLLEFDPFNNGFLYNENNKLTYDFLIIDEYSMTDIFLTQSLLSAVRDDAQVLFVGDIDQLPSVGAGQVFRDIIESGLIKVFRLNKVFRQGKGSEIITYSHNINNGIIPTIENPLQNPNLWKDNVECLFIESGFAPDFYNKNEYSTANSLRYGYDLIGMLEKLYKEIIIKYKKDAVDIQTLIPMRIGSAGSIEINKKIQSWINPEQKGKHEIKVIDNLFRVGDKVIQTVNNYTLNVFNGDIGRIESIDHNTKNVVIKFDDASVVYDKTEYLLELELAYAITIHKSQGSEFDYVILPIVNNYYRMLYRNLIYTGLTRAKKLAVFIGERKSLEIAVKNNNYIQRQTTLKYFLQKEKEEIF